MKTYTEEEIRNLHYVGRVCSFELRIGSNPSKYNIDVVEGSLVFFIDDAESSAEDKLLQYIKDMKTWYADGHQGLELKDDQWLEYACRRYTGYSDGHIDLYNPFGHFCAPFDETPFM